MTSIARTVHLLNLISIHTLHTEGDVKATDDAGNTGISIHTLHTEGDTEAGYLISIGVISIHTLHTEGDVVSASFVSDVTDFNPHPPHGG